MTQPFTGSPIAHPKRKRVRTYTGHVENQSEDITEFMGMLQTGWSTERAPKPIGELLLVLDHDESISGTLLIEGMSSIRNGVCQFILTRWHEQIFHWYLVQIQNDGTLIIEEYENPPDLLHIPSPRILA